MKHISQKGFTLVEMVAVLGIFTLMTSIVLFNYTKFRSDTILTNMAYEVALSIREAQVYGVSARGVTVNGDTDFSRAYGIYFPAINTPQYILFADSNDSTPDFKFTGSDCINDGGDTCVLPYTMQRNIQITALDFVESANGSCDDTERLSILFKRPNPEPVISKDDEDGDRTISKAQITITAPDGAQRFVVIYNNGQVAVTNDSICNQE
jgi:prepilin-type N-terminal cleavage/methylation domain-containing protein